MLYVLALVVVGGCGFSPSSGEVVQPDARRDGSGQSTGSGEPTPQVCHVTDPGLQLCIDFEDPQLEPSVADLSTNNHIGTTTHVDHTTRNSQSAAIFTNDSDIHIAESPDLNIANNLTYETWITVHDGYASVWPIDNDGEYAMHVVNKHISCFANGAYADAPTPLTADTWHHVACTYGNGMLKTYVDAARVACIRVTGTIADVNGQGMELGQSFDGELDDIHIFSMLLDNAAIAAHVGVAPIAEPAQCIPYQGPPS